MAYMRRGSKKVIILTENAKRGRITSKNPIIDVKE
jgi:hypothetical protein